MMSAFKIRALYLIIYMAFATWRVYYNIFLEDLGFKGSQIGTLNALMQSTIFFVVAYWGVVADKRGIRPTLRLLVIICCVFIFLLGFIHNYWILLFYIPF
ncbi:MAG: MFS transporter [Bacteroidales bacterium]|nr:MFS transporter [Bacteroidales bacterium]